MPSGKKPIEEIAQLEALLKKDPASPDFHRLADAYTRAGRFLDAAKVSKKGLKHHPQSVEGHVALGRSLFGANKLQKAAKVLRKSLDLPVQATEPFRLLGEILLRLGIPSEAVVILELAIEKGVDDRSIQSVLERARLAEEQEQTQVMAKDPELPRGMGNVAVAGTIGATGEVELIPGEKTIRTELGGEPRHLATLPMGLLDGDTDSAPDWSDIDDGWEQELEARSEGSFSEIGSDVGGPFDRRPRVEIKLPPLKDPLAEGMPPLPPDPEDSDAAPFPVKGKETEVEIKEEGKEGKEGKKEAAAVASVPTSPLDLLAEEVAQTPEGEETRSDPALADTMVHAGSERPKSSAEVQLEDLLSFEHGPDLDAPEIQEEIDDMEALEPAPSVLEPEVSQVKPGRKVKKRRGWIWMLTIFVLFATAGGGGVYFWKYYRFRSERDRALQNALQARLLGTLDGYQRAITQLKKARSMGADDPRLAAEGELLAALAWFHYRVGSAPKGGSRGQAWPHVAARVVARLGLEQPQGVHDLLKKEPQQDHDMGLRLYLLARASWQEGEREQADRLLQGALERLPRMANAHLLAGHLSREMGYLEQAEAAYRKAIDVSPKHPIAAVCLAAVLLERESSVTEIREFLAKKRHSPAARAWRMAVDGERRFREGEREAGAREIQAALAVVPPRADLLYYAVHALIRTGEHDVAIGAWERLQRIRSMEDPAMIMLGAELDLSRGLVRRALKNLEGKELPTRGRLLRAAGLLETGKPKQVLEELAKDESMVANAYKQMATLMLSAEAPLEPLKELAKSSTLAQLLLVRALLARQKLDEAQTEVKALTNRPLFRNPALTALARIYLSIRSRLGQALTTVEAVLRASPGYLPAREVQGQIYLAAGRYQEAVQQLSKVAEAGRTNLSLLSALTRAHAMLGSAEASKSTMKQVEALGAPAEELRRLRGFTQLAEGRAAEAAQMLKGATDLIGQVALGRAYLEAGDPQSAQRVLKNAVVAYPTHPLPHLWLGQVLTQSKEGKALAHFRAAIERTKKRLDLYPRSNIARAYVGIARPLLATKRRHPALIMNLKAAIAADRASAQAWGLLGQAYLAAKRYRPAREALDMCVKLDPKNANAFFLLGTAVKSPNARARPALQRFLELEPNGPRAKQARRQLRRLR